MPRINRPNNFKNPFFRKTRPKKTSRFYYSLMTLGMVIFIWVYFLFNSNFFYIKDWEINGLDKYKKQEIDTTLYDFFDNKKLLFFKFSNIFIFNVDDLQKHLSSKFIFKNIGVKKFYPHKIILNLEEKEEKLAIYNKDSIYIIADDGTIIKKEQGIMDWVVEEQTATSTKETSWIKIDKVLASANTKPLPNYTIFCDAYNDGSVLEVGDTYPKTNILTILMEFIDSVHARTNIKVKLATLQKNKINPKIIIHTTNNWKIYLNNTDDGIKQFYKFYLVLNNKIKDPNKQLEYIDLRFGDRVYTK